MLARRLLLAGISLGLGIFITWLEVTFAWQIAGRQFGLGTTFEDYGVTDTVLTILSLAIGFAIILDKFMKTEILPH